MPSLGEIVTLARTPRCIFAAPLVVATLLLAALGTAAQAAPPDPLAAGPAGVTRQRYEAGSITLQDPGSPGQAPVNQREAFRQFLRGDIHFPSSGSGPWPVVVNVHGNHGNCFNGVSLSVTATLLQDPSTFADCKRTTTGAPDTRGYVPLPNDEGYDYIAENLASHGYLVISIDQNELMAHQPGDDRGMYMRSQLIAAHLDALTLVNEGLAAGNLPQSLAGKIDLSSIGLQGHSRGGDGVTNFVDYNRSRPAPGRRYPVKAVLSIAPTDYERRAPYGVAYSTLLPLCDGDVSNVQGARFFERSQHTAEGDAFPRIQFNLHGTNHNYYNTSWVDDDGSSYARNPATADGTSTNTRDLACGEKVQQVTALPFPVASSARLTQADQRKTGLALEAAFMRRYVGGETAFEPYMTGEVGLPASACKADANPGVACDQELSTNFFDGGSARMDVVIPDNISALDKNALGGALTGSGFSNPYRDAAGTAPAIGTPTPADTPNGYDVCNPEPVNFVGSSANPPLAPKPCPLPALDTTDNGTASGSQRYERESAPVNRSYGNQLALAWDKPARLTAAIPAANANVSGFGVLALSTAVNYFDTRNEQRTPASAVDPAAVTQDFDVVLTDARGKQALVAAADPAYGNALQPSLGAPYSEGGFNHRGRRHIVLEQVRIPVADFTGVDLERIRSVELRFGGRTATGSIQLSDVRFQEGVFTPPLPDLSATPSKAPPAGAAVGDVTLAAPGVVPSRFIAATNCLDNAAPTSVIKRLTATRAGVQASGTVKDTGCSKSTAPAQVYASFTRRGAKPAYRLLKGRKVWSLSLKKKLVKGAYVLRVRAADLAGNLESAITRRVRVR